MVDNLTKEKRSKIMSSIKGANTKPEIVVRRLLHAAGYRYRLHAKDLPGKPDIVFRSRKQVIFVHGCFWHCHDLGQCSISHRPTSNSDFWKSKFDRNQQRDKANIENLCHDGWDVLIIWECEITSLKALEQKVFNFLENHNVTKTKKAK